MPSGAQLRRWRAAATNDTAVLLAGSNQTVTVKVPFSGPLRFYRLDIRPQ